MSKNLKILNDIALVGLFFCLSVVCACGIAAAIGLVVDSLEPSEEITIKITLEDGYTLVLREDKTVRWEKK